jgi:hypothetical protein
MPSEAGQRPETSQEPSPVLDPLQDASEVVGSAAIDVRGF